MAESGIEDQADSGAKELADEGDEGDEWSWASSAGLSSVDGRSAAFSIVVCPCRP